MPDTIAIICTIDEIVPHSLGDQNHRHFSLNLSVSLTNDSTGGVPASPAIFQPWNWQSVGLRYLADAGVSGSVPSGPTTPLPAPPAATVPTTIAGALAARFKDQTDPLYFRWADQPGVPGAPGVTPPNENWSRVLAHASTWPAPIPANLNLSFHITIPKASLTGMKRLFIAPEFTVNGVAYSLPGVPAVPGAGLSAYTWSYGVAGVAAFQPEYLLQTLPAPDVVKNHGPFFDFNTYWIATAGGANPAPEANASEDWRFTLESKAADAFDLVQRVLVVLREDQANASLVPPKPTLLDGANLDLVWAGLVAAQRDNADYGLRYAPDGLNTLRFVLGRPNVRKAAKDAGIAAEKDYADAVGKLESALKLAAAATIPPTPSPDWTTYWNALLKQVVGVDVTQVPVDVKNAKTAIAVLDAADRLQSSLADTAVLAKLLYQQWSDVLPKVTTTNLWSLIGQAVQNELQSLASSRTLRCRVLQANLGGDDATVAIWKALTTTQGGGYTAETTQVIANLQTLIQSWFRTRFGLAPVDPLFQNRKPAIAGWTVDLTGPLATDAGQFQERFFHDSSKHPTRISHPVIIQIGDTQDIEADQPGNLNDPSRRIAGVGLLIREHPHNGNKTFWACANISNLYTGDTNADLVTANVIVPLRQKKRNNLKQPVLAYNSGSLVADADSNPASDAFPATPATQTIQGLFQYRAATPATVGQVTINNNVLKIPSYAGPDGKKLDDWKRVPVLKDGRIYDLLPFMVGNNSAIPFALAAPGTPAVPVTPVQFDANWTAGALTGYVRTVTYKRRVGVGPARLGKAKPGLTQDQLPPIPPVVVPLARDFPPATGTDTTPLLLLWNSKDLPVDRSTFTFTLRPPACDPETWDRWVAGLDDPPADPDPTKTATFRNTRIAVSTALGFFAPKSNAESQQLNPMDPNNPPPDMSIDDPAVSGLMLTMTQVYPPPKQGTPPATLGPIPFGSFAPKPFPSTVDATSAKTLMAGVQADPVKFVCKIGPTAQLKPDGTITVPQGQVWSLTVEPVISAPDKDKFEGPAKDNAATFDLLIEAVQPGAFDPASSSGFKTDLWNNLAVAIDKQGRDRSSISVTLTAPQPTTIDWDLIHNVDVRKQAWLWMGRPLGPFPGEWNTNPVSGSALDADPTLTPLNSRMWELSSFAERSDENRYLIQCAVNFSRGGGGRTLHVVDVSEDARAQYYRFGIDVHSRYEGLPGLTLATLRAKSAVVNKGSTTWRRCIVPPLLPAATAVPKPKVLMAIPLTQPLVPSQSPAILVISNEQWFEQWGLAEELVASLDQARDPSVPLSVPGDQANPIPEIGPNPILSASSFADTKIKLSDTAPADPMGTTFDQATTSPLFANTTFLLDPSKLGLPLSGVEHLQARVRFQRVVNGSYFGIAGKVQSETTDSFLIEFQPGNKQVNAVQGGVVTPVDLSEITFAISFDVPSETAILTFTNSAGPLTLQAGPPNSPHLQLWALIMREITDVTGNPQLTCLNIFVQDVGAGGRFIVQQKGPTAIDSAHCTAYLIEVLSTPTIDKLGFKGGIQPAAEILFPTPKPGQQPGDTPARINRMFQGIKAKP